MLRQNATARVNIYYIGNYNVYPLPMAGGFLLYRKLERIICNRKIKIGSWRLSFVRKTT